jgi:hypothetical protein
MSLDLMNERGTPLEKQQFTLRELVQQPYSKLDDDAFTRVRVILMNGIEAQAVRFSHSAARMNRDLQLPLARMRRIEHLQQTVVNWLNPPDQNVLETTIGFEQVAIEITAQVALNEPDPALKRVYEFGMLEDFDHMYRFAALMDRLEGKDANAIIQSHTDLRPGRPTAEEHRAPDDDLRHSYARESAHVLSKLHAQTIVAAEHQVHDYYMNVGPTFADPAARMLYAEIAAIEEQHVTQYETLPDPSETWLEKWLLNEATEVWNYWSCYLAEPNPNVKKIWERFLDYELGHLHAVMELFRAHERRDPAEILPATFGEPIAFVSHRDYIRDVLRRTVQWRANGREIVEPEHESEASRQYRAHFLSQGAASEIVSAGWVWSPGGSVLAQRNGKARAARSSAEAEK